MYTIIYFDFYVRISVVIKDNPGLLLMRCKWKMDF